MLLLLYQLKVAKPVSGRKKPGSWDPWFRTRDFKGLILVYCLSFRPYLARPLLTTDVGSLQKPVRLGADFDGVVLLPSGGIKN